MERHLGHLVKCFYELPRATVTKYRKIGHIYSLCSGGWRCWLGHTPSDGSRGDAFLVSHSFWGSPAVLGISGRCNTPISTSVVSWYTPVCVFTQTLCMCIWVHLSSPKDNESYWIRALCNAI